MITIVRPGTFLKWLRQERKAETTPLVRKKNGRPQTADELEELVVRLARENCWGYSRIVGELRKLGVRTLCRSTVKNILLRHGFDLGPKRGEGTWDEFLKIHAKTLWACDFLSAKAFTLRGLVDVYLLVFIHPESRRVWLTPATEHPDSAWVTQQARNFGIYLDEEQLSCTILLRDRDTKFVKKFDETLQAADCRVKPLPFRSPNLNARCERFIGSLRRECLDHFVILGVKHLNYLTAEFRKHYLQERPHQGLGNERIVKGAVPREPVPLNEVACQERLGGLLKHYHRRAA